MEDKLHKVIEESTSVSYRLGQAEFYTEVLKVLLELKEERSDPAEQDLIKEIDKRIRKVINQN